MIGTRNPTEPSLSKWVIGEGKGVQLGSNSEAAKFGEVIILATKWQGTENALKLAEQSNLTGKVVIDVTNPIEFKNGRLELTVGHTSSGGEIIQALLPHSRVVKCWNIVGNAHMIDPSFEQLAGAQPDMWICGNDDEAKRMVCSILNAAGWTNQHILDAGNIIESRLLEPMCILWCNYYFRTRSFNHAFALLRK